MHKLLIILQPNLSTMKFFKFLAVTLMFITFTSQLSIAKSMDDPSVDLRFTITEMLKGPQLHTTLDEKVRISFFVTGDGEVVVLKTDARTKVLDGFIKERLNYHKIDVKNLELNRIYQMKVHFELNKED